MTNIHNTNFLHGQILAIIPPTGWTPWTSKVIGSGALDCAESYTHRSTQANVTANVL